FSPLVASRTASTLNSRVYCLRFSAMDHLLARTYRLIEVSTTVGQSQDDVSLCVCDAQVIATSNTENPLPRFRPAPRPTPS
ncbi:hypothetical protein, partial [Longimicrobium sp.]|uniref:hypothetical protein n=1 Tax=Longimicrobium sp. TaxID=2029185 RepID=UPI002C02FD34